MSDDHVYRLRSWVENGQLMVDERPLGGGIASLGRLEGDVLIATTDDGAEHTMVWVSDDNMIALWIGQALRNSRRGSYPDIDECRDEPERP